MSPISGWGEFCIMNEFGKKGMKIRFEIREEYLVGYCKWEISMPICFFWSTIILAFNLHIKTTPLLFIYLFIYLFKNRKKEKKKKRKKKKGKWWVCVN